MAKEQKDLGRQGDMGGQHQPEKPEVGKQGGDIGKQGGMPEKKEWEKEKEKTGTETPPR